MWQSGSARCIGCKFCSFKSCINVSTSCRTSSHPVYGSCLTGLQWQQAGDWAPPDAITHYQQRRYKHGHKLKRWVSLLSRYEQAWQLSTFSACSLSGSLWCVLILQILHGTNKKSGQWGFHSTSPTLQAQAISKDHITAKQIEGNVRPAQVFATQAPKGRILSLYVLRAQECISVPRPTKARCIKFTQQSCSWFEPPCWGGSSCMASGCSAESSWSHPIWHVEIASCASGWTLSDMQSPNHVPQNHEQWGMSEHNSRRWRVMPQWVTVDPPVVHVIHHMLVLSSNVVCGICAIHIGWAVFVMSFGLHWMVVFPDQIPAACPFSLQCARARSTNRTLATFSRTM